MGNIFEIFVLSFFSFFAGYFPGRVLIQNFNFDKEEKFVLNFAFSFSLFYVSGFLSYVFNSNFTIFNGFFLLIFLILSFFHIYKKGFNIEELKLLKNFFVVFLVLIFYQTLIPLYFGGLFYFDWFEHYLRSVFFLDRLPKNIVFEGYIIPSRPPFFNIVCFFYLSILGGEFYKYQIVSTLLNSMIILSIYLFCKKFLNIQNKNLFLIVSILTLLNPAILRQITYTWTKAFCSFYIITGLYFYLRFIKEENTIFLITSSFLFGISFIVHFSAGSYIVPVFLHLFFKTVFNKKLIKKSALFFLTFLTVIFTYFSWSIKNYGVYRTFLATNAFQQQKNLSLINRIEKDLFNFKKTLIPYPLKIYMRIFENSELLYKLFNNFHSVYICTIPGNLTITLTILLLIYLVKNVFIYPKKFNCRTKFLIFFLFSGYLLGTIVNPLPELSGVAHTGLLPLTCLFICFGINYIFTLNKKSFYIFLILFFIETIFVLYLFTFSYNFYSDINKILYLVKTGKTDSSIFSNFLLKYYNSLIFLHDKIFLK